MKSNVFVQFMGLEVSEAEIMAGIKQWWKEQGKLVKELKTVNMYVKPEEKKVYFTINESVSGSLDI